jgi:hypothetical protein
MSASATETRGCGDVGSKKAGASLELEEVTQNGLDISHEPTRALMGRRDCPPAETEKLTSPVNTQQPICQMSKCRGLHLGDPRFRARRKGWL